MKRRLHFLVCLAFLPVYFPASAAQHSQLWGSKGEVWSSQSRLPDFSFAGYHRGRHPVPNVKATENVTNYGAVPNDGKDDTKAFQDALNAAVQGAVLAPKGRYVITGFLDIRRPGIVLRGADPDQTTLFFPRPLTEVQPNWGATTSGRRTSNYSWSGGFVRLRGDFQSETLAALSKPAERGDRQLQLDDASDLAVGQEVEVYQKDTDDNSLAVHLYSGDPGPIHNLKGRTSTSLVARILSIEEDGIVLDRPLRCDHRLKWNPRIRRFEPTVRESGIEELTFEFPNKPYEGHFTELGNNAVSFRETAHCWVRNIRVVNADSGLFIRGMFNTVEGLVIESDRRPDDQRNSTGHHGVTLTGADNLLTEFDIRTRFIHDITVSHHTSGNVVSDGRGADLSLDHHRYANFENLFTDLDAGNGTRLWRCGGGAALGKHCGARGTFWNIRADQPLHYPPDSFGPASMNLVGLHTHDTETTEENGKWFEVIPPDELEPRNLHRAQLKRRLDD